MIKIFLNFFYILFWFTPTISLYAQGDFEIPMNPSLENLIPPSPNASALGKFGNIPVGLSTGIPKVQIPIYSYKNEVNGMELDIRLDYHAGGIRVDEVASNVGIGWALIAGGVISRTIRGISDEFPIYGFINTPSLPTGKMEGNLWNGSFLGLNTSVNNNIASGILDAESDIFNYSFNGEAGKFVLGKGNDQLLLDQSNIKIEKIIGKDCSKCEKKILSFTITDELGYRFIFDAMETTTDLSLFGSRSTYSSSWYLTEIQPPFGNEKISLIYEDTNYRYEVGSSINQIFPIGGAIGCPPSKTTSNVRSVRVHGKRLSSIEFPNEVTLEFKYDANQRQDLEGDHLLNKIIISNNEQNRKGFDLVHDYSLNRATLLKVIPFSGHSGNELLSSGYAMQYDLPLPNRISGAKDHWGFYNKWGGNGLPEEYVILNNGYQKMNGENKMTNSTYCKAGSLKKITYPTGGYTLFEMEANQATDSRLSQTITILRDPYPKSATSIYCTTDYVNYVEVNFEGKANTGSYFTFNLTSTPFCNSLGSTCKIVMELYEDLDDFTPIEVFELDGGTTDTQTFYTSKLTPRRYWLKANMNYYYQNATAGCNFKWTEERDKIEQEIHIDQLYIGGLRAKRIVDFSNPQKPASIREYSYVREDGKSSGILAIYPTYSHKVNYGFSEFQSLPVDGDIYLSSPRSFPYMVRSSNPIHNLLTVNGSPVMYSRVLERQIDLDGHTLGEIERKFTTGLASITHDYPFTPTSFSDYSKGLLKEEIVKNADGVVIKRTINEYNFIQDDYWKDPERFDHFRSSVVGVVVYHDFTLGSSGHNWSEFDPSYYITNDYYPDAGRMEHSKTTTFDYSNGKSLVNEVNYEYDDDDFYLRKYTQRNSKGQQLKVEYTYPKDMVETGRDPKGVYNKMISYEHNMLSQIVEKRNYSEGKLNFLNRTDYYEPYSGVFVPQAVTVKKGDHEEERRLNYLNYTSGGKPVTVANEHDRIIHYIWAKDQSILIGRISQITGGGGYVTSFEDDGFADDNSKTGYRVRNTDYELNVEGLSSGDYILTYWKRNEGIWQLIRETFKVLGTSFKYKIMVNSSSPIDELRFYPLNSEITTYTYDPFVGVTSETDTNNKTTYYQYDNLGRLKSVFDEEGNILNTNEYRYITPVCHDAAMEIKSSYSGKSGAQEIIHSTAVVLKPGFSYKPSSSGDSFRVKIECTFSN